MILELDCGNSFIKWRVIRVDEFAIVAGGVVDSDEALIATLRQLPDLALEKCRLVSVRNSAETEKIVAALAQEFSIQTVCASAMQSMAGVRNGYEDYTRLGLDRWLAVVGAYHLAGRACVVIDLGTAATSDFVMSDGEHLGGFICPGMPLMRNQLRTHTRRIRYDDVAAEEAMESLAPGRTTAQAVERGCSLMLQGFAATQLSLAREYLVDDFEIFITGGDAGLVEAILPGARLVPDLIFVGLALACPLS